MRKTVDELAEEMLAKMSQKEIKEAAKVTVIMIIKAMYRVLDKHMEEGK